MESPLFWPAKENGPVPIGWVAIWPLSTLLRCTIAMPLKPPRLVSRFGVGCLRRMTTVAGLVARTSVTALVLLGSSWSGSPAIAATRRPDVSSPRSTFSPVEQAPTARTSRAASTAAVDRAALVITTTPNRRPLHNYPTCTVIETPRFKIYIECSMISTHGQAATVDDADRMVPGRLVGRDQARRR